MKIAHLSSVHQRYDTRIFHKQCKTFVDNGDTVYLIVADGNGDELLSGVNIIDVGRPGGRVKRIFQTTKKVLQQALLLDCDVYQLHDPELIPIGLKLKRLGKRVVFDSHEDVPKQLMSKPYLNRLTRWILSMSFSFYERLACRKLDGVLTATPTIREKFKHINCNVLDVNNFPLVGELNAHVPWGGKSKEVCYVGGITHIRGICEVIRSLSLTKSKTRLNLVGSFSEKNLQEKVQAYDGWKFVDVHGQVNREGVRDVLGASVAGLVTFHPMPNHVDAQPNKMFEYMSAGIPVIASDFPMWRDIIEGSDCGLCVDPMNPQEIAEAIDFLVDNPSVAAEKGRNGHIAVMERYNWDIEAKKLLNFYAQLI